MSSPAVGRRFWLWPLLGLLLAYKYAVSPILHFFAPGAACRYEPSCSVYAIDVVVRFGAIKGVWLALRRFLDCHPWGHFGIDPAPEDWPGWLVRRKDYYGAGAESPHSGSSHCCHRGSPSS